MTSPLNLSSIPAKPRTTAAPTLQPNPKVFVNVGVAHGRTFTPESVDVIEGHVNGGGTVVLKDGAVLRFMSYAPAALADLLKQHGVTLLHFRKGVSGVSTYVNSDAINGYISNPHLILNMRSPNALHMDFTVTDLESAYAEACGVTYAIPKRA